MRQSEQKLSRGFKNVPVCQWKTFLSIFVLVCFVSASLGQQIYYRFYHGHTKDERFKGFLKKAHVLQRMCEMTMAGKVTD
ncbi:MAG: hypothetical protein CM1200mP40_08800 [Gammaproteobacteria bacterium]|nr:MAG: hypothetical protein CM1200mP40_08800 [Gammaproteobacteria bacterium]